MQVFMFEIKKFVKLIGMSFIFENTKSVLNVSPVVNRFKLGRASFLPNLFIITKKNVS